MSRCAVRCLSATIQFGVETADVRMPLQNGDIFVNIVLPGRSASRPGWRAPLTDRRYRENIHLSMEMRLTGVVNEVAADEVTPEMVRGVHDGEAACR